MHGELGTCADGDTLRAIAQLSVDLNFPARMASTLRAGLLPLIPQKAEVKGAMERR
jgi:hypothetical protein